MQLKGSCRLSESDTEFADNGLVDGEVAELSLGEKLKLPVRLKWKEWNYFEFEGLDEDD